MTPITSSINPYRRNSPPIRRLMSNRLAARAAWTSSSSVAPVGAIGEVLDMAHNLLGKDDVEDHDQGQRDAAEQDRGAPPQLVARVGSLLLLRLVGHPPHEPSQLP